jgi:6-carboxyhexanoate--CoA ligase
MRASRNGLHISGAERIVREGEIECVTAELIGRAKGHGRGVPDAIRITVNSLEGLEPLRRTALPVTDIKFNSPDEGQEHAVSELVKAGVSEDAARHALGSLINGPSPSGGNMRGAMLVDAATGTRLEHDPGRGIRARAMDYDAHFLPELMHVLDAHGLSNTRIREALSLATKAAHAPSALAELCISDNPGYLTGYVSSLKNGYVRMTPLKGEGDITGGRAFFVDGKTFDMDRYIKYLRETPVLVEGPFKITNV